MSTSSTLEPPGTFRPGDLRKSPERVKDFFQSSGYLVLEGALSPAEIDELRAETVEFCRGRRGALYDKAEENEKFQAGVDALSDEQVQARVLCIHHAHKVSPVMRGYLAHAAVVDVLTAVVGPNVKCMQSMLFIKASGKPGQAWHQDEDYIPTRDRSLPNTKTSGFRRALVNHYMRAESLLPWRVQEGVPIAKMDYRDIVMVAGKDPYAFKGCENLAHAHVRPAGEGGCGEGRTDLKEFRERPLEERAFA